MEDTHPAAKHLYFTTRVFGHSAITPFLGGVEDTHPAAHPVFKGLRFGFKGLRLRVEGSGGVYLIQIAIGKVKDTLPMAHAVKKLPLVIRERPFSVLSNLLIIKGRENLCAGAYVYTGVFIQTYENLCIDYIYIYTHIYIYAFIYKCIYVNIYYKYVYVNIYEYICIYVCMCIHLCM